MRREDKFEDIRGTLVYLPNEIGGQMTIIKQNEFIITAGTVSLSFIR